MRALFPALLLILAVGPVAHPAPKGKSDRPAFEPVVVSGHWDGDAKFQPWLKADDGITWLLVFPSHGVQAVELGPLTAETRVRVSGLAGVGCTTNYLIVSRVELE